MRLTLSGQNSKICNVTKAKSINIFQERLYMKRYKHKLLTLLSVLAIGAAVSGAAVTDSFGANAETKTYTPSSVFSSSSSAEITKGAVSDKDYMAFAIENGGYVTYKQDLAYRWFSAKNQEEFFSMELSFLNKDFTTFTVIFESSENNKTEDDKATNKIIFSVDKEDLYYQVNDETKILIDSSVSDVKISFRKDDSCLSGEYIVCFNDSATGYKFTNIGGYYAEYSASSVTPLTFKAETESDKRRRSL